MQIARVSSGAVCPNKAILSLETAPPPSYQDVGDGLSNGSKGLEFQHRGGGFQQTVGEQRFLGQVWLGLFKVYSPVSPAGTTE